METAKRVRSSEGQYRHRGRLLEARWSVPRFLHLFVYRSQNFNVFYESQFIGVACVLGWKFFFISIVWSAVSGALERQTCVEVIS